MYSNIISQLSFIMPELFIAFGSIFLLLMGAFSTKNAYKIVTYGAISLLVVVLIMVLKGHHVVHLFNEALYQNLFTRFFKILIILGAIFFLILFMSCNEFEILDKFELPILVLFATLGMLLMVTSNHMMSLYLGLELQSLSLYALTAFDRSNVKSSEAGIKYFILGSLSSGILLYGISILYGYTGHLDYPGIADILAKHNYNIGAIFGVIFILSGVAFKLSAVPFHMWTPDVYEGAPTLVSAFLASAAKIAAIGLLINLIFHIFSHIITVNNIAPAWKQVIAVLAVLSMFVGAFGAIAQKNIKRLIAYSSINHIGYILLAVMSMHQNAIIALLIYVSIYLITIIGIFTFVLSLRAESTNNEAIIDISGLAKQNSFLAIVMTIYLASLAGIPPFAGFFAKWYILSAIIQEGYISFTIIAMLASAISVFYYLRLIKIMWFDEALHKFNSPTKELKIILIVTAAMLLLYVLFSNWLYKEAFIASSSLFK